VSRSAAQLTDLAHGGSPTAHLLAAGAATSSSPSPLWYATRATGVVALVLLTITVALGVAGASRLESPRWPRVVTAGLHKNISLLVVAFVAVHVLTTVLDSFVSISPVAAIIPFASSYRPLWLSLGAIAFDMLLALVATSLIRSHISYGAWKAVHWLAYACWPVALWHGLGTGTDTRLPWLLVLDASCVLLVAGALLWRLQPLAPGPAKAAATAATVALPVATVVFVLVGPLQHGWAKRAGTPIALLAPAAAPAATASPAAATVPDGWSGFTGQARITPAGTGGETITVTARTTDQDVRDLTIVLRGTPDGSGISMSSGSVQIVPATGGPAWAGPVTTLDGAQLTAALRGPRGATEQVQLTLVIRGHQASGKLQVHPAVSQ
jgi:sulfoxide reductase heme-binding subunit YedZ